MSTLQLTSLNILKDQSFVSGTMCTRRCRQSNIETCFMMYWTIYQAKVHHWRMDLNDSFGLTDLSMMNALEANELMSCPCNMSWIVLGGSVAWLLHKDQRQTALWWWSSACFEMVLKQISLNPLKFIWRHSHVFPIFYVPKLWHKGTVLPTLCPVQCAKWQAGVGLGLPPIQIFAIQRRGLQNPFPSPNTTARSWQMRYHKKNNICLKGDVWWPWPTVQARKLWTSFFRMDYYPHNRHG